MVKIPKVGSNYPFLAVILNDFVLKKEEEFYPQVFLKECNYVEKEKKTTRHITEDLEIFSNDSDESNEE